MEVTPENLTVGIDCIISPDYANNDNFSATLIQIREGTDGRLYCFEDCEGDIWDCTLSEIDEIEEE